MGLTWKLAGVRPEGAPHTVFQLVNHMIFWQEWVTTWLDGAGRERLEHASTGWPGAEAPAARTDGSRPCGGPAGSRRTGPSVSRGRSAFEAGQDQPLEMLHTIAAHTSYHVGQSRFCGSCSAACRPRPEE